MDQIIVEGNKVILCERVVKRVISVDEWYQSIVRRQPITTGRLPENCVLIHKRGHSFQYLIEIPSRIWNISYEIHRNSLAPSRIYSIQMPWTYIVVSIRADPNRVENCGMFFMKDRFHDEENDIAGIMTFPNVAWVRDGSVGRICLGEVSVKDQSHLYQVVNALIQAITSTLFNQDEMSLSKAVQKILDLSSSNDEMEAIINALIEKAESEGNLIEAHHLTNLKETKNPLDKYMLAWEYLTKKEGNEFLTDFVFPSSTKVKDILAKYPVNIRDLEE